LLLLALLACKRGGKSGSDGYWNGGCVSPGAEGVILLGGDESTRIDVATGAVQTRKKEYRQRFGCRPDGSIVESGTGSVILGSSKSGRVVKVTPFDDMARWDQVTVVEADGAQKVIDVSADKVPEIGSGSAHLLEVEPVGVIDGERGVFAAAYAPMTATQYQATHRDFALYSLDLPSGQLSLWGKVFASKDRVHQNFALRHAIARDGRVALGVFGTESDFESVELRPDGSFGFRHRHTGAREPQYAALSADGAFAAVGLALPGGGSSQVDILDLRAGRLSMRWPPQPLKGNVCLLYFLDDGTLVVASSARMAARISTDGRELWRSKG
jgi:hypothetical protein